MYEAAVTNPITATKCDSWENFVFDRCASGEKTTLGLNSRTRLVYFDTPGIESLMTLMHCSDAGRLSNWVVSD